MPADLSGDRKKLSAISCYPEFFTSGVKALAAIIITVLKQLFLPVLKQG